MIEFLQNIQAYGWPLLGLLVLVFIVALALEDLFRSAKGKGKHK